MEGEQNLVLQPIVIKGWGLSLLINLRIIMGFNLHYEVKKREKKHIHRLIVYNNMHLE